MTKRGVQVTLPIVLAALLLIGSVAGEDHHFPFGPLRMYSTKQDLDARIKVLELWGRKSDMGWTRVTSADFGMRRADLEGQLGKHAEPPSLVLERLATSFERIHRSPLPYEALQFRNRIYQLQNGEPHGESTEVIGTWEAEVGSALGSRL